jgi:peptidoglycan hydrolase-like protein with peptidoglycan-binding domain
MSKKKISKSAPAIEVENEVEVEVIKTKEPNPYPMPDKNKKLGDFGNVVKWIQFQLGIETSGEFDEMTESKVKMFQIENGLDDTGIVDKTTRLALAKN